MKQLQPMQYDIEIFPSVCPLCTMSTVCTAHFPMHHAGL